MLGIHLIEKILDFVGFTYFLTISGFQHPIFPFFFKTIKIEDCFGPVKIINIDLPRLQRSHVHPKLCMQYYFENMFDLISFTYALTISGLQRFINIPPSYSPFLFKTIVNTNCLGANQNSFQIW